MRVDFLEPVRRRLVARFRNELLEHLLDRQGLRHCSRRHGQCRQGEKGNGKARGSNVPWMLAHDASPG